MEVLSLQIFVSLVLVLASILLFAFAAKGRDHEHAERLALLPLDDAARLPVAQSLPRSESPREENP